MSKPDPPSEQRAAALDVLLDFLGRAECINEIEFERMCARRPELECELRRLQVEGLAHGARQTLPRASAAVSIDEYLQRLRGRASRGARYRRLGLIGRGGMGAVHRVWDVELDRLLAMKIFPVRLAGPSAPGTPFEAVARFLEEARTTGQLDHPGIVPVHEVGIDADEQLFFTMKFVEGRDLRQIIELARAGAEGWGTIRILGVLLNVCEAMAYAHSKGVIHRDLKPSNVMVGRYGEVYVMDWGIARVLARRDELQPSMTSLRALDAGDPLATGSGTVLGTPAYMAPEQACGESTRPSERADVYSLGAMLYHVLSGHVPFATERVDSSTPLERVLAGPPRSLRGTRPRVPVELCAVCEKAMSRTPEKRYASMLELAEDLRAYLEGRVVRARKAGRTAALMKWGKRNPVLTGALAIILLLASVGSLALHFWRSSQADLMLLGRLQTPSVMKQESNDFWPIGPEKIPAMQAWLARASVLAEYREKNAAQLQALRARALPFDPESPSERQARSYERSRTAGVERLIAFYENERERLEREGGTTWEGEDLPRVLELLTHWRSVREKRAMLDFPRTTWGFSDPIEQLLHDRLAQIGPEVDALVGGDRASLIERVRRGAAFAAIVRRRSLEEPAELWTEALASIRDPAECPRYRRLVLAPQLGLVPIGRDPESGLWEFAHLQSGEPARRGADGRLILTPETGLVLVLVPPGGSYLGAQNTAPELPNFDPFAQLDEQPVQALSLDAFFLSKYELTRLQWERWAGFDPKCCTAMTCPAYTHPELHPAGSVTWLQCMELVQELGLTLPTEAQWEYAARAGTEGPWSTGLEPAALHGSANVFEDSGAAGPWWDPRLQSPLDSWDDGWTMHAPVGSLRANPFGFHDVHGNVGEWCRDRGDGTYPIAALTGTGERQPDDMGSHPVRGGGFMLSSMHARSAARREVGERRVELQIGLRPAREIER
jgi:serine/threonine protein kinase/formylglycine-generating enzyme required for sulfatase activity